MKLSRVVKFIKQKSRGVGIGRGESGKLFDGYRASVLQDEKVLVISLITM